MEGGSSNSEVYRHDGMKTELLPVDDSRFDNENSTANGSWSNLDMDGKDKNSVVWTPPSPDPSKESKSEKTKRWLEETRKNTCRRKTLDRRLPIAAWLPKYSFSKFMADMIAGFTVGLTILPQSLAYASLAGLQPQYGLYSGFIGCFVYIVFGSRKEITIGPTAVLAIVTYCYIHEVEHQVEYAIFLCFFTGVVTSLLAIFQFGFIVNFISKPVSSAFSSAAAITIATTQIKSLLGIDFKAKGVFETWAMVCEHIGDAKLWDVVASVISIAFIMALKKLNDGATYLNKKSDGRTSYKVLSKTLWFISTARNALTVILGGVAAYVAMLYMDEPPFALTGHIIAGLPTVTPPPFSISSGNSTITFTKMASDMGSAFVVLPLLAIMEHISIAKACAGSKRVDSTQEMLTIGITNIVASFFHSMPVTGSFSRSTVNHASGVQTPFGGLLTGVLVILSLQFMTPYLYYIPEPALAAVIICAVISMVEYEVLLPLWHAKRMDLLPALATFLISLLLGLEYGILAGLGISVLFLLYYAARPGIKASKQSSGGDVDFILVQLDRSLVFPSVSYIRCVISKAGTKKGEGKLPVVVDCHHIQFVDFTAASGVKDLCEEFNDREQKLIFYRIKASLVRIINGVKPQHFNHCQSEEDLERLLNGQKPLATVSSVCGDSQMSLASSSDVSTVSISM